MVFLHTYGYRLYLETSNLNVRPCGGEHYLGLYQRNMIDVYLSKFKNETYYVGKDGTQYQIKGLIDSIFKVLTSEILFIFKTLWDIKYGSQREDYKDIYTILPVEYKKVFYILRGIYFSKKVTSVANKHITIKTVYEMLKKMEPTSLVNLLRERRNILQLHEKFKRLHTLLKEYSKSDFMDKTVQVIDHASDFILGVGCNI